MQIKSDIAGTPLKDYNTEISWRNTTNYAASIQDNSSHYFNDEMENGIVAHPMFSVAVTWPILGKIWEFIDSDSFPHNILMTQVHYTEHLIIHRLMRPGDKLKITGIISAIQPHRSGTHSIAKLLAVDEQGDPVFTEYSGAMMRGVKCTDDGSGIENIPAIPENSSTDSGQWDSIVKIDPLRPYIYDGCTDIVFPIHTSPQFAKQVGLPGIILQGTATLAYAVKEIVNREAEGNPNLIKEIACKFTGMVLPGTKITIKQTGVNENTNSKDVFFEVINSEGVKAITKGYVKIKKEIN